MPVDASRRRMTTSAPTEQCLDIYAVANVRAVGDIAVDRLVHARRSRIGRGNRVESCRQRIDVDQHLLGRILGRVGVGREDDGDGLAHVADGAARQHGLKSTLRERCRCDPDRDPRVARKVGGGDHRQDAGTPKGGAGVDSEDHAVRDLAAYDAGVDEAGTFDVVDERRVAAQQWQILDPEHRRSHVAPLFEDLPIDCDHSRRTGYLQEAAATL